MPAYVIGQMEIHDPEQYSQYTSAVPETVEAFGGRFVVRGGEIAPLEGEWQPKRLVVLEFEDLATAKRWYESDRYQEVKQLREGAATLSIVAVEGV